MQTLSRGFLACSVAVIGLSSTAAVADFELFFDTYESGGLAAYTGGGGFPHHGVIVTDPLNPTNHVLAFTARAAGGDMFSTSFTFDPGATLTFSLDYLGVPGQGNPGDLGGFASLANPGESPTSWLYGTSSAGAYPNNLIDDGAWHSYSLTVHTVGITSLWVTLEDFIGSGGVAGDAYFDNVRVAVAPTPGAAGLLALGGLAAGRRRRM